MKIETKKLIEFLKKINMDGNEKIDECLMDFSETGLKVSAISPTKVNRVDAILKSSSFEGYEAIGQIGIQDLSNIIRILGKFGDKVDVSVEGNIVKFNDKTKTMVTELVDTQFINAVQPLKDMQFDDFFTIQAGVLKEIIDDASINKEFVLEISTVEKGVKFDNTGKYKFSRNVVVDEAKGGVNVVFGQPLVNAVRALTGKLEMNVKSNFPIKILEKTDDSIVSIIVAPTMK